MNYRKWPVQSVLWLTASTMMFILTVSWDVYHHVAQGRFFGVGTVARDLVGAIIFGWYLTLAGDAKRIGALVWFGGFVLSLISYYELAKTVPLSPLADTVFAYASVYLPLLVAVGVVLVWLRRGQIKEIQTIR